MSNATTNPFRTRLVAEAVVSAYIHEIAPSERPQHGESEPTESASALEAARGRRRISAPAPVPALGVAA